MIAIFDIGKTNKKCLVFDASYQIVWQTDTQLPTDTDEDGWPCESLPALEGWINATIKEVYTRFPEVQTVNVSAYGASLLHLDQTGKVLTPLYDYFKPYPEGCILDLENRYGSRDFLAAATASPFLGNLNAGLQLWRILQERPDLFRRIHRSLHLPQYLAYCLHGKMHNERTSMGCHTLLWDFSGRCFPYWATDSGVAEKFPDLVATDAMETTADSRLVGVGLHDSSAALLPYLIGCPEPFALLSTGTWCVTMVPADAPVLSIAELKRDCLYYLTPTGKPVRASRYPGGLEHDRQIALLAIKHQLAEALFFQAPEALPEAARRDYADWMQTMVAKQVASTRLAIGNARIEALYVDGGFSRNRFFMEGLATAFREIPVFAATVGQASALGAALILHRHWNKGEVPSDIVQLQPYPPNHENGRP